MSRRFEYKYLIPMELLEKLRNEFAPYTTLDPFLVKSNEQEYTVRSIYYDTDKLTSYYEKVEGLPLRRKIRVRGYGRQSDCSMVFLEIKRKIYSNIEKTRALLPYNHVVDFLENDGYENYVSPEELSEKAKATAEKFLYYFKQNLMHPVVLVTYEREAYFGKFDKSLRITFDKNLRSTLFPQINDLYSDDGFKSSLNGNFILEIKFFNSVPVWFKNAIRNLNLTRKALSKYTICIDTHNRGFNSKLPIKPGTVSNPRLFSFFLES